jgi:NTP pyrophosphatase (non-canonical NTP hydrolase)
MDIKEAQNKIREFDIARGWEDNWNIKDLLLNITEEGGEMWSLIKWIDDEKQKQVVEGKKEDVSDYIGDTLFLLLKIANQTKVDAGQALQNTLDEYEKRMPPDVMKKVGHANKLAGGVDNKQDKGGEQKWQK